MQALQITWFFLIGVLFIGYSVLDGFDLGVGSLLPILAKEEKETASLLTAIGPFWDGNEVWLLTAGGALFAAFPHVYATVFSGFYLALMIILFALIFRAVSFEFWSLDRERRRLWKWAFVFGSLVPSLLFGVALGNVIQGVPLDERMEFTGTFFTLLRPLPLATGLLGLCAILLHGSLYAMLKTEGSVSERARSLGIKLWAAFAVLFAAAFAVSAMVYPGRMGNVPAWIFTGVVAVAVAAGLRQTLRGAALSSFVMSAVAFIGLWCIAASLQFPVLVRSAVEGIAHLTIYNTSSSRLTLSVMLIIALIGMPLVLGYTIYVYRVFRGKVTIQR
ncbi:MAG: cytochrome d ubiquinol oxidase subunit II [Spirochaetes bacterium]|nr:cytochrome d ubiquinol oxidase subunit II [Spirochaetota bacterium]